MFKEYSQEISIAILAIGFGLAIGVTAILASIAGIIASGGFCSCG